MKISLNGKKAFRFNCCNSLINLIRHERVGRKDETDMNNREMIDEPFNDGEHIIYVNGANKDGATELGKLMHDFFCTDPDDMHFKELADKVRYFKEDEKGVAAMCKVMEDMRNEVQNEVRIENARRMIADGLSLEKVAEYSGLSMENVQELAGEKGA